MFLYVGATSLLKVHTHTPNTHAPNTHTRAAVDWGLVCVQGNYTAAAEELIVHTFFFSGSRDVLPQVGGVRRA